jgi:hypothetical protein
VDAVDADTVRAFLARLGTRQLEPAELMLLGGSALLLLGSGRATVDIDYVGDDLGETAFQRTIAEVAAEMHVQVDPVPIERFVPMPSGADRRRVLVARIGVLEVFVVDPYAIALSKLDRGTDADIADIGFLVAQGRVDLERLGEVVEWALLRATEFDMDAAAVRRHLGEARRRGRRA